MIDKKLEAKEVAPEGDARALLEQFRCRLEEVEVRVLPQRHQQNFLPKELRYGKDTHNKAADEQL